MSKAGDTADELIDFVTETPFRLDMDCAFDAEGKKVTLTARMHPIQGKPVVIRSEAK